MDYIILSWFEHKEIICQEKLIRNICKTKDDTALGRVYRKEEPELRKGTSVVMRMEGEVGKEVTGK